MCFSKCKKAIHFNCAECLYNSEKPQKRCEIDKNRFKKSSFKLNVYSAKYFLNASMYLSVTIKIPSSMCFGKVSLKRALRVSLFDPEE